METATRDAQGRFMPGCSGNPAGKKPGTLNYATIILRRLREDGANAAVDELIAKARKGNLAAIRILLDRIDPKPRGRAVEFEFDEAMDLGRACRKVVKRMSTGDITPSEGGQIIREIERTQRAEIRAATNPLQRACISGDEAPCGAPLVASAMGEGRVGATAGADSPTPVSAEAPMPPPAAPLCGAPTSGLSGALPSAAALMRSAHGGGIHEGVSARGAAHAAPAFPLHLDDAFGRAAVRARAGAMRDAAVAH